MKVLGFGPYLRLQLKRSGKLLYQVLLVTGLLLVGVGLLAAMILDLDASDAGKQRLNIGIVGDPTDTYLNLGIYAIETLDSSRFSVSFQRVDKREAEAQLKAGSLSAYLVIPDGFVEAVSRGENKPITYVSTDGAMGLGSAIADEVVGSVSDLLLESQNAIFGMQRYGLDHGVGTDLSVSGDKLSENYMAAILNREALYDMDIVGVSGNLSMLGYYLCGLSLVFLLLWGIGGCSLFVGRDLSLNRVLRAKGLGSLRQVTGEYVAWFSLMVVSFACACLAFALFLKFSGFSITELGDFHDVFLFFLAMLPVAAMLSMLQFFLYELVSGPIHCILLQFSLAIALGYLSGCFYPIQFFPESIQHLQAFLPTGAGLLYLEARLSGGPCLGSLAAVLIYFVVFFCLTVLVRQRRLCR
jgi:hypothetical protein